MDFTPEETIVFSQIRILYFVSGRVQRATALTDLWPPMHAAAYRSAYDGLVAKQVIEDANGQGFRITDLGLKAMGVPPFAAAGLESRQEDV